MVGIVYFVKRQRSLRATDSNKYLGSGLLVIFCDWKSVNLTRGRDVFVRLNTAKCAKYDYTIL